MKFLKVKYIWWGFENGTLEVNKAIEVEVKRFQDLTTTSAVPGLDVWYGVLFNTIIIIILPLKI